jgi:hypothetical protein
MFFYGFYIMWFITGYNGSVATGVSKLSSFLPGFISHYVVSEQTRSLQLIGKDVEDQAHKWVRYSQNRLDHIRQENIFGMSDRTVNSFSSNPPYIWPCTLPVLNKIYSLFHFSLFRMKLTMST